jgi:hypothetical protein
MGSSSGGVGYPELSVGRRLARVFSMRHWFAPRGGRDAP